MPGAADLVAASAVVAVGAFVQGSVGFGLSLIAAPLVTLIDPQLVPGPLLVAGLTLPALTAIRERGAIDVPGVTWALGGRVIGAAIAAVFLVGLPPRGTSLVVGVAVLIGVGMSGTRLRLQPRPGTLLGAGVVSGLMGTTAAIGGPPVALVYQDTVGRRLRGTLSVYFVAAAAISITALAVVGRFRRPELLAGLALLPGVAVGFLASSRAVGILDRGWTRLAVLVVAGGGALVLVLRALA